MTSTPVPRFINASQLKVIAMMTMLIDHMGAFILLPWLQQVSFYEATETHYALYTLSRTIGRLSFPIFCFLIVEGFLHTRNVAAYMKRLTVAAVLSEIPFDLARTGQLFDSSKQNVLFTLLAGLIALWAIKNLSTLWQVVVPISTMLAVSWLATDYSYLGVLVIIILYLFRSQPLYQSLAGGLCFVESPWAMPSFILTYFYNGEKGELNSKVFYAFYPVHLLLYAGIARLLIH